MPVRAEGRRWSAVPAPRIRLSAGDWPWRRVSWIDSYATPDKTKTFCIYDGPNPEAIRRSATRNNLPVDRITEIRVLDPYFYL